MVKILTRNVTSEQTTAMLVHLTSEPVLAREGEEDANPEAEADIHFRPIVTLPEMYTVTSWDDDVDTLFSHHSKLYRFDGNSTQWKERDVGDLKILKTQTN